MEEGEAYTLGLLKELRDLCEEISRDYDDKFVKFHVLLKSIANPNLPDVAKELNFGVTAYEPGTAIKERLMALTANPTVARAAFECAVKMFPDKRWVLSWGGYIMEDSKPID